MATLEYRSQLPLDCMHAVLHFPEARAHAGLV